MRRTEQNEKRNFCVLLITSLILVTAFGLTLFLVLPWPQINSLGTLTATYGGSEETTTLKLTETLFMTKTTEITKTDTESITVPVTISSTITEISTTVSTEIMISTELLTTTHTDVVTTTVCPTSTVAPPKQCKPSDEKYEGYCYHVEEDSPGKTYDEAEKFCESKYSGHLLWMVDENESAFVKYKLAQGSNRYLIGLKLAEDESLTTDCILGNGADCDEQRAKFHWYNGDSPSFSDWENKFPTGGDGCVVLTNNGWQQRDCSRTAEALICKYEA